MITLDDSVRSALRDFRADETDVSCLARLVVTLWRAGHFREGRNRPINVLFRLSGGLSKRERRKVTRHEVEQKLGKVIK